MSSPGPDVRRALGVVLAVAFSLRLGAALKVWDAPPVLDETEYASIARNLARGGEFAMVPGAPTLRRPPLYPAFQVPFAALFERPEGPIRLAQAALDTVTCWLLFLFAGAALGDRRGALAAAALYATSPVYTVYSATLLSEPLFFAVWAGALLALLRAAEDGPRPWGRAAAAGLLFALAIECRPTVILFPPLAAAALAAGRPRDRALLSRLAAVVLTAYLGLIPWALRNRAVSGRLVPVAVGGGASFWLGSQPWPGGDMPDWRSVWGGLAARLPEAEADAELFRLSRESWRSRWPEILANLPRRLRHFWVTSHSAMFGVDRPLSEYRARGERGPVLLRGALAVHHLCLLALGAWGLARLRRPWTPAAALVLAVVGYFSLHVLVDYFPNRYHLPALLVWLAFAGHGAVDLLDRAAARRGPARL